MRTLSWDGLRNVRDLGGLPTSLSETGMTSWGRIARSPRRELLTTAGWRAAESWGLRSIVDLRNGDEVGARDTDPGTTTPEGLTVTLTPVEDQTHPEFRAVCVPILDSPEYWPHNVRILPGLVRTALEAVAASDPGVLIHCAAGRDRTGLVSALLLANAGVSGEEIIADYAESVRAMAGTAVHGAPVLDRQASWSSAQVDAWIGEVAPHVASFVAESDAAFNTLGVATETRRKLQELLTT